MMPRCRVQFLATLGVWVNKSFYSGGTVLVNVPDERGCFSDDTNGLTFFEMATKHDVNWYLLSGYLICHAYF